MYDLERYLSIRRASGASFRDDGERLAFLLDTTGVPQIWSIDSPRQRPVQHTFGDERVLSCSYGPDQTDLIFSRDVGGDEFYQLYRLDPVAGTVHPLTDAPSAIHYFGGWSHSGEEFAFTANRRDESVFDVYRQGIDERGDQAERVFEGEGWLSVGGFDPADERLLLTEAHSSFDQDLYWVDAEDGDRVHLTDHPDDARYQSPSWSPDGDGVYCVTDLDEDTRYLAYIDAEDGSIARVHDGGEWSIDGFALDDDTGRFVMSRNVDGYTELTVGEVTGPTEIQTFAEPDLPEGVAGGVSFARDAETFAITVSSRGFNPNIYVVDVETGSSDRWTDAPTAGIPRDSFRTPDLVHIESFDGLSVPGFLTLPADPPPEGAPVIMDIHGGPESQRRPSFSGLMQYFLAHGYAVFEPNVRGSSGYGKAYTHLDDVERRMDSVADVAECARWLAAQEEVDGDRIVAMGGSYGGFMVLAALTEYPELWAAGIDVVGIANFVTFLENTGAWRREHREAEYGSLANDRELLESISPIHTIDRIRAPLFVIHGENDPRVPVDEARQIVEAAQMHVPVEALMFDDEGHGLAKLDNQIEAYRRVVDFIDEHLESP